MGQILICSGEICFYKWPIDRCVLCSVFVDTGRSNMPWGFECVRCGSAVAHYHCMSSGVWWIETPNEKQTSFHELVPEAAAASEDNNIITTEREPDGHEWAAITVTTANRNLFSLFVWCVFVLQLFLHIFQCHWNMFRLLLLSIIILICSLLEEILLPLLVHLDKDFGFHWSAYQSVAHRQTQYTQCEYCNDVKCLFSLFVGDFCLSIHFSYTSTKQYGWVW